MRPYKLLLLCVFPLILAACSAGVNFKKIDELDLLVGTTVKSEVVSNMGCPNRYFTTQFNGVEVEIYSYSYARAGGGSSMEGVTPSRSQNFFFIDDTLIGKEYTSSFMIDSTYFDLEAVGAIRKGMPQAHVESLLGRAKGKYLYPIIANKQAFALVYLHLIAEGFEVRYDKVTVYFDSESKEVLDLQYEKGLSDKPRYLTGIFSNYF